MAAIKVKLVRGLAGVPASHRTVVVGMGLKKRDSVRLLPDTAQTAGMIAKVQYLVEWERVNEPAPIGRKARAKANDDRKANKA